MGTAACTYRQRIKADGVRGGTGIGKAKSVNAGHRLHGNQLVSWCDRLTTGDIARCEAGQRRTSNPVQQWRAIAALAAGYVVNQSGGDGLRVGINHTGDGATQTEGEAAGPGRGCGRVGVSPSLRLRLNAGDSPHPQNNIVGLTVKPAGTSIPDKGMRDSAWRSGKLTGDRTYCRDCREPTSAAVRRIVYLHLTHGVAFGVGEGEGDADCGRTQNLGRGVEMGRWRTSWQTHTDRGRRINCLLGKAVMLKDDLAGDSIIAQDDIQRPIAVEIAQGRAGGGLPAVGDVTG